MHSLPLTSEIKQKEWTLVQQIVQNNNFPLKLIQKPNSQVQRKQTNRDQNNNDKIKAWATFTYYSPIIWKVTKIFEHTNVEIPFKNINTIQQLTKPKTINDIQERDLSGIYKLACNTGKLSYIGQTIRDVKERHQEQIKYMNHNDPYSAYALHILSNNHA